ncbi:DUF6261 family protein [Ferruginibacter lapsinanis]|uniref:DUF6261 family protein n=1 Tax=Ferruginibacter lapsinanis TaxID=563172 RepID=UPI001E29A7AF|nr:DUF6261 family protein [Ferruginibacter lapsinanis]UEG50082.1 DUF6261 family protein [Ferruginibacter lapsinanis]
MINSIELYKLRNGEYSQFLQDVIEIVNKNDPADLQVQPQLTTLIAVALEIESLFKIPLGSALTQELENFDLLRDNALKGILAIVRGNMYSQDPVIKNHATILDTHLALFGKNIAEDSYQSETNSIRNIIADWNQKPELTAAITALDLQSWKASLETANNNFSDRYLARAIEVGTDTTENFEVKRVEANQAYYTLRDNINARYIINDGNDPYKKVVSSINGLITYYNDLLARRLGGNNDNTGPDAPEQAE